MPNYDVIIVGAGSVGVPTAMALAEKGIKTLVVDKHPSAGQGENKHAIGGVRATHTDPAKIRVCLRSLEIYATWQETFGQDIEWLRGGYVYPVYREKEEKLLKSFLPFQKKFGLKIDFTGPDEIAAVVPGINPEGLMGGTISPDDGTASPLLAGNVFFQRARALGATFQFKSDVQKILQTKGRVTGVQTSAGDFLAPVVIDAAGPYSAMLNKSIGIDIPVVPESHEGAVTEPVQMFCPAMVVDMRPAKGSLNYYYYQNKHGQLIFCITPDPPIIGTSHDETSLFLPQVCSRMVNLMPRLKNIRVRRVWRGLYPTTPDGSPFVSWNKEVKGLLHATGMCGQGFMLGPGVGEVVARMVTGTESDDDGIILDKFSLYRDLSSGMEALK
jgi:sarcosine oxidase subunit beta